MDAFTSHVHISQKVCCKSAFLSRRFFYREELVRAVQWSLPVRAQCKLFLAQNCSAGGSDSKAAKINIARESDVRDANNAIDLRGTQSTRPSRQVGSSNTEITQASCDNRRPGKDKSHSLSQQDKVALVTAAAEA